MGLNEKSVSGFPKTGSLMNFSSGGNRNSEILTITLPNKVHKCSFRINFIPNLNPSSLMKNKDKFLGFFLLFFIFLILHIGCFTQTIPIPPMDLYQAEL